MKDKRVKRLNSLLREVISEVLQKDVKNPNISKFTTITDVDMTADGRYAKIFITVMGEDEEKKDTLEALNQAAGFISVNAAKKVVLRYFPTLTFELDTSLEKHMKIDKILTDIKKEKEKEKKSLDECDE
ncbi:MAG: Ribosome-binding factor A [Candidatus Anoxychlamydiales bacterium]|uniref:Ribosome-binding factor A n=1 Tax=marine sediment metagenome TaxID=412755 RepID=A0A0F9IRW7_9ZZZZ|nr:Ribosome-binding factor A [Candidatus Anoxychlamydiales bacterium]NGX41307.1 Ribosome-binding factor A [Candidatus Anoxychlamydiales bacterium]HEU63911.1 30S ribosome-binding factor RbfA [Chlamydiota bacterium]